MRTAPPRRTVPAVALLVVVSIIVAACGGSSHKSSSSSTQSSTSTSTSTTASTTSTSTSTTVPAPAAATLWSLPNADPDGTRDVASQINSSNVSQLKQAWKIPITGVKGLAVFSQYYGVFASTPVFGSNGVVYLQDLSDSVYAVNVKTGKQIWKYTVPTGQSNGEGPNGVTLVGDTIYGETDRQAFALQAATGEQLWKSAPLSTPKQGQGINIAPQVADGKVFVSTSGQLHGGVAYALDAKTGKVVWSFQETKDPSQRTAGGAYGTGGAWGTPLVENGLVYFGIANPVPLDQHCVQASHQAALQRQHRCVG
jgi:outer membrane protein assembly factor BamB